MYRDRFHFLQREILRLLGAQRPEQTFALHDLIRRLSPVTASDSCRRSFSRDVAIAIELLALQGAVAIDRKLAMVTLTARGFARQQISPPVCSASASPPFRMRWSVAVVIAVAGCAQVFGPPREEIVAAHRTAPSLGVAQVVDEYQGRVYFAWCTDCAAPTPKTLTPPTVVGVLNQTEPVLDARSNRDAVLAAAAAPSAAGASTPSPVSQRFVVFFGFGGATFNAGAKAELQTLARQVSAMDRILIIGRTDNIGPRRVNEQLALRRARVVAGELVDGGASWSQIEIRGDAFDAPTIDQSTTVLPARNRKSSLSTPAQARRTDIDISGPSNHIAQSR